MRSSVPAKKRGFLLHHPHKTSYVQQPGSQDGREKALLEGNEIEKRAASVSLQSTLMKTGPLERFPP